MRQEEGALEVRERTRRTLAAEDRMAAVREVYEAYHDYDWKAALLADLFLDETHYGGGSNIEMDVARAEHVSGTRLASGRIPAERRWAHERPDRALRGHDGLLLPFAYGRWA